MKKVLLSLACVAFTATIAVNFYVQQNGNPNEILLTDIEALAEGGGSSGGGGIDGDGRCYCPVFMGRLCTTTNNGPVCPPTIHDNGGISCSAYIPNC